MEIVLLKDVKRLGEEGAVLTVKPGYARNFLIPYGFAVLATAQRLKTIEEQRVRRDQRVAKARAQADALKRKIEGRSLTLKLNLGEGNKSFGSITTHDVVDALAKESLLVDKHAVRLEEPIKTLGFYEVPVRLHPDVMATLKLVVTKA